LSQKSSPAMPSHGIKSCDAKPWNQAKDGRRPRHSRREVDCEESPRPAIQGRSRKQVTRTRARNNTSDSFEELPGEVSEFDRQVLKSHEL